MYALFVVSEIAQGRGDEAEAMLKERMGPRIKDAPGFISGTWARDPKGKEGRSLILFANEQAARDTRDMIMTALEFDTPVKVRSASVLEVVHQV